MKPTLIVLIVGLLAVGCLTPEQKQKRLRDSVVGEYHFKHPNGTTIKLVFLENSVRKHYENGKKPLELKWTISNGELHVIHDSGYIVVRRINPDKSITSIATIRDGKRTDIPEEGWKDRTYKKIK